MRRSNDPRTPRCSSRESRACTVLRDRPSRSASATAVDRGSSPSAWSRRASISSMVSGTRRSSQPFLARSGRRQGTRTVSGITEARLPSDCFRYIVNVSQPFEKGTTDMRRQRHPFTQEHPFAQERGRAPFGGLGDFGPGFGPGFGPRGGRGRGHGPGRRGHGGRRSRRGDVRAAILALLAEQPRHGYEIIREIGERSGGFWRPSPGSVYPTLQLLADEGLVVSKDE